MKYKSSISFHLHNVLHSSEFYIAIILCLLALIGTFTQNLMRFWGADVATLPSPARGWMAYYEGLGTSLWLYFVSYLLPIISALLCADVYVEDVKAKRISYITTRMGKTKYTLSLYAHCILFTFIFILSFMLVSQLLEFLVFPMNASIDSYQLGGVNTVFEIETYQSYILQFPFGQLAVISPYLFNFAYMVYDSAYLTGLASIALAISFYFKNSRIFIVAIPTILIIVFTQVLVSSYNPAFCLYITVSVARHMSLFSMLISLCMFYLVSALLIVISDLLYKRGVL